MKKIILTVVLSALFIAPVFASEAGDMEILGKIGYTLDTDVKIYTESKDYGSTDKGIVLGADFCFYIIQPHKHTYQTLPLRRLYDKNQ